jgi:hypothetical protein
MTWLLGAWLQGFCTYSMKLVSIPRNKQPTIETATYNSSWSSLLPKLASTKSSIYAPPFVTLAYQLSYIFGDNDSMVDSSTIQHSKLHKHHNTLSFPCIHEAVLAAKIAAIHYVPGKCNPADILIKHWSDQKCGTFFSPFYCSIKMTLQIYMNVIE